MAWKCEIWSSTCFWKTSQVVLNRNYSQTAKDNLEIWAFLVAQKVKNPPAMREAWVRSLGWEDSWRRAWKPTPVFLLRESPRTEEPGGLQSLVLQRVRHDWVTKHNTMHVGAQLCPALCSPMDCSLPGSSVHGVFQPRILELVAISFCRETSPPSGGTMSSESPALAVDSLPRSHLGIQVRE